MDYSDTDIKVFGMYSHKSGHAQIFDCTRQVREVVNVKGKLVNRISPALVYDKLVQYRTYKRNLRKLGKQTKG